MISILIHSWISKYIPTYTWIYIYKNCKNMMDQLICWYWCMYMCSHYLCMYRWYIYIYIYIYREREREREMRKYKKKSALYSENLQILWHNEPEEEISWFNYCMQIICIFPVKFRLQLILKIATKYYFFLSSFLFPSLKNRFSCLSDCRQQSIEKVKF